MIDFNVSSSSPSWSAQQIQNSESILKYLKGLEKHPSIIFGPPWQARQTSFGTCLDFRFQYAPYKKQHVKKICGRILDLAWLKFTMAALILNMP